MPYCSKMSVMVRLQRVQHHILCRISVQLQQVVLVFGLLVVEP